VCGVEQSGSSLGS